MELMNALHTIDKTTITNRTNTNISSKKIQNKLIELIESKSSLIDFDKLNNPNNKFSWDYDSKKYSIPIIDVVKRHIFSKKYAVFNFMELMGLTVIDIFKEDLVIPQIFNVFGCELSTDIDVVILLDQIVEKEFLDLSYIVSKLKSLSYDINDDMSNLDIQQVTIDVNGNIVLSSKGSKETQNMIYYTYNLHKQYCPPIFSKPIDTDQIDILGKIKSVGKLLLDYYESFFVDLHDIKKEIYNGPITERITYTNKFISEYTISNISQLNSALKSICIKMCQIIILEKQPELNIESYSKLSLAKNISNLLKIDYNYIISLFTRSKIGSVVIDELNISYHIIVDNFIEITNSYLNLIQNFESNKINLNYTQNLIDSDSIIDQIIHQIYLSPIIPSAQFLELMKIYYKDIKIEDIHLNTLFVVKSNYESIKDFISVDLQQWIESNVDLSDQRSEEWVQKYNYFSSLRKDPLNSSVVKFNGTTLEELIYTYYNLCRGSAMEIIMQNYCDFNSVLNGEFAKFKCGFLKGCLPDKPEQIQAPDLLLIDTVSDKIIPVEMKCLVGEFSYNANVIREIKIANLQIKSYAKLLKERFIGYGIIVLMFVSGSDNIIYDLRYSIIKL
jgi:hypothetical protein